jgi:hypothetical protein
MAAMTLAAAVFCGGLSVPAFSQSEAMTADIPFAFYVGGKLMPAGSYRLKAVSFGSPVMNIANDRGDSTMVGTMPALNKQPSNGRLVFSRYGSEYFLSELDWAGYETGRALRKTSYERELIAGHSRVRIAVAAK